MNTMQKALATVTALAMLSACSGQMNAQNASNGGIMNGSAPSKSDIGTLLGAGAGAIAGSAVTHGKGKVVGGVIGGLLGAALGNSVGASLDRADMNYYERASYKALETQPAGQPLPWKNPQSGNYGSITPQAPYKNTDGQYCREYTQSLTVGGKVQSGYGTACRQPDGSWQIVQ